MTKHPRIRRRAFLQATGVSISLPWLESNAYADPTDQPKRMLLISNNLGVLPRHFFPQDSGPKYTPSPYLQPLQDYRDDFTVFTGLSHPYVEGGHSTENCFLTAAKHPTGSRFRNTISLDQYAAEALRRQTRFPTLNLGVNLNTALRSLSWTRDGVLLPAIDSPAALFTLMFTQGSVQQQQELVERLKRRESILDAISATTSTLKRRLSKFDHQRIDQYFTSIRELEKRLESSGQWATTAKPKIDVPPPTDITDRSRFIEKLDLMLTMARLALQTDSTRIVTLMLDAFETGVFHYEQDNKTLTGYHNLSHHGQRAEHLEQLRITDIRQMELLGQQLKIMKSIQIQDESLLDQTMLLFGSNMGNANTHTNTNLPILLAGGKFQHGEHLVFDREKNTPLSNLFVSMLQNMKIETNQFGSSTGPLEGLRF
ncbi:MAG: hypothetical protein CMJ82_08480 [Planctomycetaceae bacterium]|nr:hypothetical protein [Planctomycetaceae bacterium]|tara:strand:- start:1051 stop:2331 length:1281 start_codon:yes stop_codon:yes gene_type:complete